MNRVRITGLCAIAMFASIMLIPYRTIAGSISGSGYKIFSGFELTVDLRNVKGGINVTAVKVEIVLPSIQVLCQVHNGNPIWSPANAGQTTITDQIPASAFTVEGQGKASETRTYDLSLIVQDQVDEGVDICKGQGSDNDGSSGQDVILESAGVSSWDTILKAIETKANGAQATVDVYHEHCVVDVDGDRENIKEINGIDYNLDNPNQDDFPDGTTVHNQSHTCTVVCHTEQTLAERQAGVPDCPPNI